MLRADDHGRLDRSVVWQPGSYPNALVRGRPDGSGPLGVRCVEATVMVTDFLSEAKATADYETTGVLQSTGAVQASGAQRKLAVHGLVPLAAVDLPERDDRVLGIDVLERGEARPSQDRHRHQGTGRQGAEVPGPAMAGGGLSIAAAQGGHPGHLFVNVSTEGLGPPFEAAESTQRAPAKATLMAFVCLQ